MPKKRKANLMLGENLQNMACPPEELNILGEILPADNKNIVVIGTKNITRYGKFLIKWFIPRLVKNGYTIISTFTHGCDLMAQETAVACGGRTIGILACGLDEVQTHSYNSFITGLIGKKAGAVISPFNRATTVSKETMVYRNSAMAFLGNGVLVIEAGRKSGVFSTVSFALEYGKNVFAFPGDIFKRKSIGTNNIIKDGGYLVNSIEDITNILK